MKRLFAFAVAVFGATAIVVATAAALPNDVEKGCVDIVDGNFFYNAEGHVSGSVTTREPACRGGKYTLYVLEESTSTTILATAKGEISSGSPIVVLFATQPITTIDTDVCVYVEARQGWNFERAPDTDCVALEKGFSPGGTGMN